MENKVNMMAENKTGSAETAKLEEKKAESRNGKGLGRPCVRLAAAALSATLTVCTLAGCGSTGSGTGTAGGAAVTGSDSGSNSTGNSASTASGELKRYNSQFLDAFDTISMLIGYDTDEASFQENADFVHQELLRLNKLFDIYNSYDGINNLKTINDNAGKQPVKVDPAIISLLKFGKEADQLTEGNVNMAFGAVLRLWHDARETAIADASQAYLPEQAALEEAAQHTDPEQVVIDEEASTVYLQDPEMALDVGGFAKGWSVEYVAQELIDRGVSSFLLNIGGNLRAIGTKGDGSKWICPVENPQYMDDQTGEQYAVTTYLSDSSLVTSGDYERYFMYQGKRYCHIIDPATLQPATAHRSATILLEDSGTADVLSTALFILSEEEGKKLLEKVQGAEAMWVNADGSQSATEGFAAFTEK